MKGGRTINPGYQHQYSQVIRSPRLFHQYYSNSQSAPVNFLPPVVSTSSYWPNSNTSPYAPQTQYNFNPPAASLSSQAYYYYPTVPVNTMALPVAFSAYNDPTFTYTSTVSSRGLTLVLIAILILVALDLVIVRPQKKP